MATLATIPQVRALTADKYQYDRAVMTADGVATDYAIPNPPVLPASQKVYVNGALQTTPAQYTINPDLGVISFVVAPVVAANVVVTYTWSILSDADVQIFIDLQPDVRLCAADVLDTIASSEVLVSKVITILDLTTNGDKVAATLRAHAQELRLIVAKALAELDGGFDVVEQVMSDFAARERALNEALRALA
jgi:hypothetical protein